MEVRVYPKWVIFFLGAGGGRGVGHAQKFFSRRRRRRPPPRKILKGEILRMGIWYSRNVRLVLGFMEMVWIYWNVGFDKESFRKKLGMGVWDVFGVQQMIKMRLIDIRVEFGGNPAFQKCWGGSLLHFLAKGLAENPNIWLILQE